MKNSDPYLEAARKSAQAEGNAFVEGGLVHQRAVHHAIARRQIRRWARVTGLIAGAVLFAGGAAFVSKILTVSPTAVNAAPAWSVEIISSGKKPTLALVYGEDAGMHLIRVPSASSAGDQPQIISARLAKGELHMFSLSLSSLRARSTAPTGTRPVAWSAEGHVITAYQNRSGTGVRTSW